MTREDTQLLKPELKYRELLQIKSKRYKMEDIYPSRKKRFRLTWIFWGVCGAVFSVLLLFVIVPIPEIRTEEGFDKNAEEEVMTPEVKAIEIDIAKLEGRNLILTHINNTEYEDAYREIKEFSKLFPDDPQALEYKKAVIHELIKNIDKSFKTAKSRFDYGYAFSHYYEIYLLTKDPLAEQGMSNVINVLLSRAKGFLSQGKVQDAFEWAEYARTKQPGNKAVQATVKQIKSGLADIQVYLHNQSKIYELEQEVASLGNQMNAMRYKEEDQTKYSQLIQKYTEKRALLDKVKKFSNFRMK
jgi:hypothetical protein